jgi:hypothetical protein
MDRTKTDRLYLLLKFISPPVDLSGSPGGAGRICSFRYSGWAHLHPAGMPARQEKDEKEKLIKGMSKMSVQSNERETPLRKE